VKHWADYASRDMTLRPDAGRYEPGTLNVVGSFALRASLQLLLDQGLDPVSRRVMALGAYLAAGLEDRGFELMIARDPGNGSGIVSCRKAGQDANRLVAELKARKILAAPRQGWIRFSPHFYLTEADLDQVFATLDELTS
jgi:selenocysteine lyase/cysteine desulfurase